MIAKIHFSFLKEEKPREFRLEQLFSYTIKLKRQRIKLRARFYLNSVAYFHISEKMCTCKREANNHLDYVSHIEHVIH